MKMFNFIQKPPQIGLDIGSSSIKIVQLTGGADSPVLSSYGLVKIEEKNQSAYRTALESLARKLSFKGINISISGPSVVVRYIELPKMEDEELKSSMKFEAAKYIPFDIKEVVLDSQIIEYIGTNRMRVLLAAAKKDAVNRCVDLVESAGFSVKLIDCDSFALVNAFTLNFPEIDNNENTALLNIGEKFTIVNILKGKTPYFTREFQLAGNDFAKAISEELNIDIKAASGLKEKKADADFRKISDAARPVIMRLLEEIRLSMSYYENQVGSAVDKVYLSGGFCLFGGLADALSEGLGVLCEPWDPFKRVKVASELPLEGLVNMRNYLAVAMGLALRG